MLTKQQEKTIRSLAVKKGRKESGLCLIEGAKNIEAAGDAVVFTFTRDDVKDFDTLVTTETPQDIAAIARTPEWKKKDIELSHTIVVLDGVQDPGNVGTILRLCLGFDATLLLIDSADPTNPKVIRSSAGALFTVPWIRIARKDATNYITKLQRPVYRLEGKPKSVAYSTDMKLPDDIILIAGSEGRGISLNLPGQSLKIEHNNKLESLNVAAALAILLSGRYQS